MKAKIERYWAVPDWAIQWYTPTFGLLPKGSDPYTLRRLRRQARKQAKRERRRRKRYRPMEG